MIKIDKRILNFLVIIFLTPITFTWTFFIFHQQIIWSVVSFVIFLRILASLMIFKDYSLSWSNVTQRTFLLKCVVYLVAFIVYLPFLYGKVRFALLASEFAFYLLAITALMYLYHSFVNRSRVAKTKDVVIYGAGQAGTKLVNEFRNSEYRVKYFIDDNKLLQKEVLTVYQLFQG